MIFIIAVFAFGEPFGTTKLVAFAFIWAALFLYSGSMLRMVRAKRLAPAG
jgi:chloramphenicol-sensitive protein RarD